MIDNAKVVKSVAEAAGVGRADARKAMSAWWAVAWRLMFATRAEAHDGAAKAAVMLPGVGRLWSGGRDERTMAWRLRRRDERDKTKKKDTMELKRVRLRFDSVMTTSAAYDEDEVVNGVALPKKGCLKEVQEVLAVGPCVKDVKAGDMVKIDLTRYLKTRHEKRQMPRDERFSDLDTTDVATQYYEPKTEVVGGERVLLLNERDIDFIVEEFGEAPAGGLVIPAGPRLVTA